MSALSVTASGPAADAIATHVPTLVTSNFASRLFEKDPTLWGPDAEPESRVRLAWVGLPRTSSKASATCRKAATPSLAGSATARRASCTTGTNAVWRTSSAPSAWS